MTKETKRKLLIGFTALIIIGIILPDNKQQKQVLKKENNTNNVMTLRKYKQQDIKTQVDITKKFIITKDYNLSLLNQYDLCMEHFANTKNKNLNFSEVIEWCHMKIEPNWYLKK